MSFYKVEAVVLKSVPVREADFVLTLYGRETGKIRAMAHGIGKPSSRKRGALQPFCHSRLMLRRGRELDTVSQCEGLEMFVLLREDLNRLGYAVYLCELVDRLTPEGEPNAGIFLLLLTALRQMVREGTDLELLAWAFEIKLAFLLGYRPQLRNCASCGSPLSDSVVGFSARQGGVICTACRLQGTGIVECIRGVVEIMDLLLRWELTKLNRLRVSEGEREQLRAALQGYLQYFGETRFRSLSFLEEILSYRARIKDRGTG